MKRRLMLCILTANRRLIQRSLRAARHVTAATAQWATSTVAEAIPGEENVNATNVPTANHTDVIPMLGTMRRNAFTINSGKDGALDKYARSWRSSSNPSRSLLELWVA
jgi:hypothetical protein